MNAILFDLDGVLVDAVAIHRQAFLAALLYVGCYMTPEEHDRELNGLPTLVKLDRLVQDGRLPRGAVPIVVGHKQRLTGKLVERRIGPDPEKRLMLNTLAADGYRLGCVSNAIWTTVTRMLALADLLEPMEVVLSNEDLEHPKPAPDGWLIAMKRLGVRPKRTLIVEDSPPGRISAHASGAHVLEVEGPHEVTLDNIRLALRRAA